MRITVNSDNCVGSGQCALALPELFDQDDVNGKVVLLDDQPSAEWHDAVHEAASRCPVQAITAR
ncbi:ferredoxin [Micromonospora sp. RTGN7]|uniref:ferredoxin n=1 Tax=Micromonospora sp. RTGN7 TaxID=3016526 RepID=UPI0029FF08B8|nr:ferredoxin [Micromonospora sp. RTGN7]